MEYNDGASSCPRCDTGPGRKEKEQVQRRGDVGAYAPLLSTYNAADIAIIKSVLDNEEIDYHLQGEYFNMAEPLVQPARFYVARDQLERAREALQELRLTFLGVSFRDTEDLPS